jgi:hypothetical protein
MDAILVQVRRAWRRLIVQRFLDVLAWSWFAALAAVLLVVSADRFWPLGLDTWVCGAGGTLVGLLLAAAWTFRGRSSALEAAIELDRRFALKERVSSALALTPADCNTEAGQALLADALRSVERLDVRGRFAVRPSRRLLLPLLPGILAALVVLLIAPPAVDDPAAKAEEVAVAEQVKKTTETVRQQLADSREQAKKKRLQDAERLLLKLEEGVKEIKKEPTREKALTKLNDLSRTLADRRRQIGADQTIKGQLEQFKGVSSSRIEKCEKALNRGDLKKAAGELQKLKDDLKDCKLDGKQKEKLAHKIAECQGNLQRQRDEMKMLDDAEDKLTEAKEKINCKCGEGNGCDCEEGQYRTKCDEQVAAAGGLKAGTAIVHGLRTKEQKKIKAGYYDSRVKQNVGRGSASVVGLVDGPNVKGSFRQEVQKQVESVRHGTTDPLAGRQLPRKHGEHAREYFDGLRDGKE